MNPFIKSVLAQIHGERVRQDAKWGEQNHPDLKPGLLAEAREDYDGSVDLDVVCDYYGLPFPEEAKARTDGDAHMGAGSWVAIAVEELVEAVEAAANGDEDALRTEVVQLAAVCVSWVQAIDRRRARREQAAVKDLVDQRLAEACPCDHDLLHGLCRAHAEPRARCDCAILTRRSAS